MEKLIERAIQKGNTIAVIGASNNPEKYGYKIFKHLKELGFEVIPVNPNRDEVQGVSTFPRINDVPEKVDVADIVVPPQVSMTILEEIVDMKEPPIVWLQPGAESEEVLKFAKEHNLPLIHNECIMVETGGERVEKPVI